MRRRVRRHQTAIAWKWPVGAVLCSSDGCSPRMWIQLTRVNLIGRHKMVAKSLVGGPLLFVLVAALLLTTTGTALPDSEYKTSSITKVVLLGTGTPGPVP